MNLVQINERLKDLPIQVIQQYANGMNPEVPPYLALGELQRREIADKQAAIAQGGAQGPQPSIKEQMEQKAGLMQAQQMQQQQMAQQQQQPRGPMPVPAGIPQPEAQPQMTMARGGLTSIPVRPGMFEYADGGIIAFQSGGRTPRITEEERAKLQRELLMRLVGGEAGNPPRRTSPMNITESDITSIPGMEKSDLLAKEMRKIAGSQSEDDARRKDLISRIPTGGSTVIGGEPQEGSELGRNVQNTLMALPGASATRAISGGQGGIRGVMAALAALSGAKPPEEKAEAEKVTQEQRPPAPYSNEGRTRPYPATPVANAPSAGARPAPAPGRLPSPPRVLPPAKTIPVAQEDQSGLPAAAAVSPFAEALASARQKPTAPTAAGIIAEQKALSPASMQEEAMQKRMEDQRARAGQERAAYEKSRPSGLDELIRVFGQAGQYKGLSGMGPAYTAMQQQNRAEDTAMERRQNELLTAIEGREYEGGKELYGARAKSMDAANKSYQDRLTNNSRVLADLAGVDERRMTAAADRLNQMDIAKLREVTANKSASEKQRFEANYLGKKAQARALAAKGDAAGAARLEAEASDMLMIRTGAAAGERNDITAEKAVQASLLKELSENLRMDAATRARKQTELDESIDRMRKLSGGVQPSPTQTGKVPPPPPGFKVN